MATKTAADLMAELEKDPEYQEQQRRAKEELQKKQQHHSLAEVPLVRDLNAAGADVSSIWDLVNTKKTYANLLPILLDHLDRPYPDGIREGIARAMAVPEARLFWEELVDRYLAESDSSTHGIKWALHLAIAEAADATVLDTLIRLTVDRRHGRNRALFVDALARIDDPKAHAALIELARDPDLSEDITRVMKRRS